MIDPSKVFVVHGRNRAARTQLFRFLRSLNLRPIEWQQATALPAKPTPTISQILETAFAEAQAVVILMTGDDEVRLLPAFLDSGEHELETRLSPQARPNVIFEAGRALGTHPDRTVLVQIGECRPFSDVAGLHIVRMDNTIAKRQDLAKRLEAAGCPVDFSGSDWHDEGNFEIEVISADNRENETKASLWELELFIDTLRTELENSRELELDSNYGFYKSPTKNNTLI